MTRPRPNRAIALLLIAVLQTAQADRVPQSGGDGRPDTADTRAGQGNPPGYFCAIQRLGGGAAHDARRVEQDQG